MSDRIDCTGRPKPKTAKPRAMYYAAACLPRIQEIAGDLGYAVAVHGSLANDLDLVCVPWAHDAGPPEEIIARLAKEFSWWGEDGTDGIHGPTGKPHGRLAWSIVIGSWAMFDVSIMPRGGRHEEVRNVRVPFKVATK